MLIWVLAGCPASAYWHGTVGWVTGPSVEGSWGHGVTFGVEGGLGSDNYGYGGGAKAQVLSNDTAATYMGAHIYGLAPLSERVVLNGAFHVWGLQDMGSGFAAPGIGLTGGGWLIVDDVKNWGISITPHADLVLSRAPFTTGVSVGVGQFYVE